MGKVKRVSQGVVVAIFILPAALFVGLIVQHSGPAVPGVEIERTGYFKDDERFRVMAYRASRRLGRAGAETALANVMHTEGSMTVAAIYGPEARDPGHILTTETGRGEALALINSPRFGGWHWNLTIRHDGNRTLVGR